MKTLWLGAAAAALICGSLAGCASPHYPIDPSRPQGPAPLTVGKPRYSIDPPPAPPPAEHAAASRDDAGRADPPPAEAPLSAPVKPVETQALPPPGESASNGEAHLQYASLTTQSDAPVATGAAPPPTAAPTSAPLPAPAPAPQPQTPPGADATALTPQMVIHDQPTSAPTPTRTPPPARVATETPPRDTGTLPGAERRDGSRLAIAGDVVHASGIFENYEVQKGDHIDALARGFSTTRSTLLSANDGLKPPYVLRPGQILKVPVAKAYMAQSGDTLSGVARRFSVSVDELAELNHLSARAALRAGAEIGLPSSMRDRGPQRLTEADYAAATPPQQHYSYSSPPAQHHVTQVTPQPNLVTREQGSAGYATGRPPGATPQATPALSEVEIAKAAKGRFIWPVRGDLLNRFGAMGVGQRNDGIDIRAPQGSAVKAAADGKVVYAGDKIPGYGNAVLVQHADGWVTVYAYLDKLDVHNQQDVTQGQELGLSGVTTDGAKPAVHFEIRYHPSAGVKAQPVDPVLVLPIG
jgi:murein DD-endopeptidase MepM/ murein hydrolase activator NlpD